MSRSTAHLFIDDEGNERPIHEGDENEDEELRQPVHAPFDEINWELATHVYVTVPRSCFSTFPPRAHSEHGRVCRIVSSGLYYGRYGCYLEELTRKHAILLFDENGIETIHNFKRHDFVMRAAPGVWLPFDEITSDDFVAEDHRYAMVTHYIQSIGHYRPRTPPPTIQVVLDNLADTMSNLGLVNFEPCWLGIVENRVNRVEDTTGPDAGSNDPAQ